MYISANKVNITHSYTPQQGSTSPSTAGQEEASGPPSWPKLKQNSHMRKLRSVHTEERAGLQEVNRENWFSFLFFLQKKMKIFQFSPKDSSPPWQIGVSFKSQSPFLFLKKHDVQEQKKTKKQLRSDKQNKINTWSPLRTFGYYKDLSFPYKIFNHIAITRQTN